MLAEATTATAKAQATRAKSRKKKLCQWIAAHRHILTQPKTQLQRPPGKKNIQSMTPASMIEASGTQYFRQVVITWSIRSRGSVQRSHIMNITPT